MFRIFDSSNPARRKRPFREPGGFTVLEIFIATSVLLLIAGVLGRFVFMGKRSYEESVGAGVLQGATRKAVLSMLSELQESREIVFPKKDPVHNEDLPRTATRTEVRNSKFELIGYKLDNESGTIVRHNDSTGESKVIVKHVKDLRFTRYSAKLLGVRIVVTTDEKDEEKRREEQIVTSFFLRNKL